MARARFPYAPSHVAQKRDRRHEDTMRNSVSFRSAVVWLTLATAGLGLPGCHRDTADRPAQPEAATPQSQIVSGLKLDYGLIPAGKLAEHAPGDAESKMHGGRPAQPHAYHVVLSIADASTGQRISDAGVTVGVSGPGLPQADVTEVMTIDGQPTYGRYVVLAHPGAYRFHFNIEPAGREPLSATFEMERPG